MAATGVDREGSTRSRVLVAAAEGDLARRGVTYRQVKTLGASSPEHAATRAVYAALGYEGLEELAADTIWPGNRA